MKPELFGAFAPKPVEATSPATETLQETSLRPAPATQPSAASSESAPVADQPAPAPALPPSPAPPQASPSPPVDLGGGISATLLNVASTPQAFLATFRLSNESDAPIMISGRGRTGFSTIDFNLTDDMGTNCVWSRNSGNGRSTLPFVTRGVDPRYYTPIAPDGSTIATVSFGKRYCTAQPANGRSVSVSGAFTKYGAPPPSTTGCRYI